MGHDNVIEFNGKRYDAVSGAYLGKGNVSVEHAVSRAQRLGQGHRTIDGVVRASSTHPSHAPAKHPHVAAHRAVLEPTPKPLAHVRHAPGKAAAAHKPERAKTLARRTVHKPTRVPKRHIKLQTPAEIMAAPVTALTTKHSVQQISPMRLRRSQHVSRHGGVNHFAKDSAHTAEFVASLPVHHPKGQTHPLAASRESAAPDPFEAAMARSNSHAEPAPKAARKHRTHNRRLNILAGVTALLLLGGVVAYLNKSTIELQLASVSAGFSARMPAATPTGYKLDGPIQNKHGVVAISFRSGDSNFRITQQSSNWNSQTLLDSLIGFNKYERVESKGRTIYLYDGNKAAWVNGGVRYDVTGNAYLDKNDLVSLATSM